MGSGHNMKIFVSDTIKGIEVSPGREATCRAGCGTWGFFPDGGVGEWIMARKAKGSNL